MLRNGGRKTSAVFVLVCLALTEHCDAAIRSKSLSLASHHHAPPVLIEAPSSSSSFPSRVATAAAGDDGGGDDQENRDEDEDWMKSEVARANWLGLKNEHRGSFGTKRRIAATSPSTNSWQKRASVKQQHLAKKTVQIRRNGSPEQQQQQQQDLNQLKRAIEVWDAKLLMFAERYSGSPEALEANPTWQRLLQVRDSLQQLLQMGESRGGGGGGGGGGEALDQTRM